MRPVASPHLAPSRFPSDPIGGTLTLDPAQGTRVACMTRVTAGLLAGSLALAFGGSRSAWASGSVVPIGPEFRINTYTTTSQLRASVATDGEGGFVVVWDGDGSSGSDTSRYSIHGQRYDSVANPLGSEFQVNTYTTSFQFASSIAVAADGRFAVVWTSEGSGGSDTSVNSRSIQGQLFDSAGNAVGSEFQVNVYTTGAQYEPSVAMRNDGGFVVVWASSGSFGNDPASSIQGRRYDSVGEPLGNEFQVNTYTTGSQWGPSVAMEVDGEYVVVWSSSGSSGSDDFSSVQGQRYDSAGNPMGGEFQVNTYTPYDQRQPAVGVDLDGDFVVVWTSYGSSGSDASFDSIQGRRFDSAGRPVDDDFQVNSYTTFGQLYPSVAMEDDGGFLVVWESYGSLGGDSSTLSIQGQRYDSRGSPVGSEFQINSYTLSHQEFPSVAARGDGDFVVVWDGHRSSQGDQDGAIQGRLLAEVGIDVKPGDERNVIRPERRKSIRVALLGSSSFEVAEADPSTLRFGPQGNEQAQEIHDLSRPRVLARHLKDVNRDSFEDLVLHYRPAETSLMADDEIACLAGETLSGDPFAACDVIETRARRR